MKFKTVTAIITSCLLALLGVILANFIPLPAPITLNQSRFIFFLSGILIGLLIFAKISALLIRTFTQLSRQLILKISSEIINQLTSLTSSGMSLLPIRGRKEKLNKPLILDTSAIIDGRVLNVAKTNFLPDVVLIPDFVLSEIQSVADSSDSLKRARGRFGFEVLEKLKALPNLSVKIWDKKINGKDVDEKILRLCKVVGGKLLTVDYNLNNVATISGVTVLNLNELSNSLKALPIPGEKLDIKVVSLGKDQNQGVGYLADGTMVVVKDGGHKLSKQIEVTVTKIIQGAAGRIVFAK